MNKISPATPRLLIQTRQEPIHREPAPLWTSSLTSKAIWSGRPADLLLTRDDARRPPLFPTTSLLLGNWDPGRHPVIRIARENPIRRDAPAPAVPNADAPAAIADEGREEGTPGTPPARSPIQAVGSLRNGNPRGNPNSAPRCGARTRLGCPCRGPAMANGRCRMHGGASTGPKTAGGRARIAAARTLHGRYGAQAAAKRARLAAVLARGRVVEEIARTGLPLEALTPMLRPLRAAADQSGGRSSCAVSPISVSPASLFAIPLTARQGRALIGQIRAAMAARRDPAPACGKSPCAVRTPLRPPSSCGDRNWSGSASGGDPRRAAAGSARGSPR